ncbi:RNA polymerase sigma factor [Thalassococcus sp. CAU 1522]|uniref:RNA polymerase sigma factor n=1 Tax=Thalassococcus arenae TaxID=2851652 RepID=A0ABS6N4A4_9RHOB|nr:RNA polymerase sigma factor [Thalassococcus arenae]MBV2358487.1 RNA polymerase sigma factor [Thalassococcus arenae]
MPLDAMTGRDDDELLARYAAGDAEAARVLTARLGPPVFAHAMRMLGGDRAEAEDVTQEAMLRLWRAAPGWDAGGAKPRTWLYTVTANLCIDRLRRRRGGMADIDAVPEPADGAPSAVAGLQRAERAAALQAALDELPDRQRQAVVLRHIEGLGNPEIAGIMDMSVRAVESLIARGKRALEERLLGRRAELGIDGDDG